MPSHLPVQPPYQLRQGHWHRQNSSKVFWSRLLDPHSSMGGRRASFWVNDFKHQHLIKTGRDFTGTVPATPYSGTYQHLHEASKYIDNHPAPPRETRRLPLMAVTPRVVAEHRVEKTIEFGKRIRRDRRMLMELRDREFYEWYGKLQRVRGRWCRAQGVTSRGVYTKAVDAAEIWG